MDSAFEIISKIDDVVQVTTYGPSFCMAVLFTPMQLFFISAILSSDLGKFLALYKTYCLKCKKLLFVNAYKVYSTHRKRCVQKLDKIQHHFKNFKIYLINLKNIKNFYMFVVCDYVEILFQNFLVSIYTALN